VVFLCGMEEGLFPHQRSLTDLDGLEESDGCVMSA